MERERSVSAAAQQERSGCGRPLSGLTVCLKAVTADEYSANSVNKDLNQKTNRALTILWLGLVSLEGAESRIESSNKCTFRAGRGCLWVVFYGFEACMWWIKQNHVNLPFLSSKSRMGVNLWHLNGLTKSLTKSLFRLVKSNVNETSVVSWPKTEDKLKHSSKCKYKRCNKQLHSVYLYYFCLFLKAVPVIKGPINEPAVDIT